MNRYNVILNQSFSCYYKRICFYPSNYYLELIPSTSNEFESIT